MRYCTARPLPLLLGIVICCMGLGCSNSEKMDNEVVAFWDIEEDTTPLSTELNYLPIDDSEYPYAGIPRIVIETENHREIKDRETEIPAKLQVWGENAPESEVMDLTIRGRGNSSWTHSPKKSYKIKFNTKESLFGMPKDRDWALIANYADKTLMKNYLAYKLSTLLDANYTPKCEFVELYLNNEYMGVYNLTETLKTGKNRINWISENNAFFAEFDIHYKAKNTTIRLKEPPKTITIHLPKNTSIPTQNILKEHLDSLSTIIKKHRLSIDSLSKWIDLEAYLLFYWIQEFSMNRDGNFDTSIFFTWNIGEPLKMGPLWDFDLAYNGHFNKQTQNPEAWFIRNYYWNSSLFQNEAFKEAANIYWHSHRDIFVQTIDHIHTYREQLKHAAQNNFKRWPILQSAASLFHPYSYNSYQAAVDSLEAWIRQRIMWIDQSTK